jgi:OmcA/MtrC family decaheme c-type cytochrome
VQNPSNPPASLRIALSALALVAGCGGGDGDGGRCTLTNHDGGTATIRCDDGSTFTVRSGTDGASCTVSTDASGARVLTCEDGTMVTIPADADGGPPGRTVTLTGRGLRMEVRSVGVDEAGHPFAELRFTDADERPLDREGRFTEGAISASFTVAHLPTEVRVDRTSVLPWQSYLSRTVTGADGSTTGEQPIADEMGTWVEVDGADGVYRYTFGATLPAEYDGTESHRLGIWATRTFEDVRYVANASPTFRPDGMAVATTREIITNDACNTCHTPLRAHGGSREDVGVCVSCHGRGFTDPDTGEALDFDRMIHRIHSGEHLPSVENGEPYRIIGFRDSVHDYSSVVFPQDVRNCATCHAGPDAALPTLQPSRAACGSCHDDIWFEEGEPPEAWMRLHPGGDRPDDTRCTVCHEATGGLSPIVESHFTKRELPIAQIPALTIEAVALTATREIQLDFVVTVNGAPRDVITAPLASLSAVVAGPTTDYLFNTSFNLTNATLGALSALDASAGRFRWTSAQTVDAIAASALADTPRTAPGIAAAGTWAIGMQATLRALGSATATACVGTTTTTCGEAPSGAAWTCASSLCTPQYTYPAWNPVAYLAVTDAAPVARREVVSLEQCNSCHVQLELHGGGRNAPEYCVMCHNATFDTIDRMPVPTGTTPTTHTLSFAGLIHRIHTGENGVSPAVYWSPRPAGSPINTGGTPVDFGHVRYPADRQECVTCHVDIDTATDLDAMASLRPVRTREIDDTRAILETFTVGPIAAACTGCHDDPATEAHAATATSAMGVEACATCHGAGDAYGADVVHARPEYEAR